MYMTPQDIKCDIAQAQEMMEDGLGHYLSDLLEKVCKFEADEDKAVITLITEKGMSTHVLDLNDAEANLKTLSARISD